MKNSRLKLKIFDTIVSCSFPSHQLPNIQNTFVNFYKRSILVVPYTLHLFSVYIHDLSQGLKQHEQDELDIGDILSICKYIYPDNAILEKF